MDVKMINVSCEMNLEVFSGKPCRITEYAVRSAEEGCLAEPCLAPVLAEMLRTSALAQLRRLVVPAKPRAVQGMADYSREYEEDDMPYQLRRSDISMKAAPLPELRRAMNAR